MTKALEVLLARSPEEEARLYKELEETYASYDKLTSDIAVATMKALLARYPATPEASAVRHQEANDATQDGSHKEQDPE